MQPVKKKRLSNGEFAFKTGSSSMTEKQKNLMLDFLCEHPSMVLDRSVGGTSNKPSRDELWETLALVLNSCDTGAQKDGWGWRRSWQDLKRYESLKAKKSMSKLEKVTEKLKEPPVLNLSPLQEKIANLLSTSILDVAESVDTNTSGDIVTNLTQPYDEDQDVDNPQICPRAVNDKSEGSAGAVKGVNTATDVNIAQALQNIANALTSRNAIEERKLRVFENLLTVYAAKNGIGISDAVNLDRDHS